MQDLIAKQLEPTAQAGLQGSPRQPMRPMRPPPPPPTAQPASSVDGVPQAVLDVWFQIADRDSDGRWVWQAPCLTLLPYIRASDTGCSAGTK